RHRHGAALAGAIRRRAGLARQLPLQRHRELENRSSRGGEQCVCLSASPFAAAGLVTAAAPPGAAEEPHFGKPVTAADIAAWDISIGPDGAGLPPGKGTAAQGETVYAAKCQACHAEKGAGGPNDRLVGGAGTIAPDKAPVKTVGSYWPYATTLFDYVRRAMPWDRPKSLTDDEVY